MILIPDIKSGVILIPDINSEHRDIVLDRVVTV